ncbi:hypothetical protein, partial [Burkholderia contaminans]
QCLPRSIPISDTVSMMALQKDKILTQRSPLSEDRADHPIKPAGRLALAGGQRHLGQTRAGVA